MHWSGTWSWWIFSQHDGWWHFANVAIYADIALCNSRWWIVTPWSHFTHLVLDISHGIWSWLTLACYVHFALGNFESNLHTWHCIWHFNLISWHDFVVMRCMSHLYVGPWLHMPFSPPTVPCIMSPLLDALQKFTPACELQTETSLVMLLVALTLGCVHCDVALYLDLMPWHWHPHDDDLGVHWSSWLAFIEYFPMISCHHIVIMDCLSKLHLQSWLHMPTCTHLKGHVNFTCWFARIGA